MKYSLLLFILALTGLLATGCSKRSQQESKKPSADTNEFIGRLTAVDITNQTVSIATGGLGTKADLFYLTPETKLFSGNEPATLDTVGWGQYVQYNFRKDDGKLKLTDLRWMARRDQAIIAIPRTIDSFRFIGSTTTVQQVFASVGLPDREIGSGIAIYDYQLSDGSHIWISTADDINIMSARHGTNSLDTAAPLF